MATAKKNKPVAAKKAVAKKKTVPAARPAALKTKTARVPKPSIPAPARKRSLLKRLFGIK